jgi:hypothetical protein
MLNIRLTDKNNNSPLFCLMNNDHNNFSSIKKRFPKIKSKKLFGERMKARHNSFSRSFFNILFFPYKT